MIPEIELRDIQPKGSSDVPSSSHIQTGLPIPKTVRVQFFSPDEWESFTEEWASYLKMNMLQPDALGVLVILG